MILEEERGWESSWRYMTLEYLISEKRTEIQNHTERKRWNVNIYRTTNTYMIYWFGFNDPKCFQRISNDFILYFVIECFFGRGFPVNPAPLNYFGREIFLVSVFSEGILRSLLQLHLKLRRIFQKNTSRTGTIILEQCYICSNLKAVKIIRKLANDHPHSDLPSPLFLVLDN